MLQKVKTSGSLRHPPQRELDVANATSSCQFAPCQAEHKIISKAVTIPLDLLVEPRGGDAVQFSQIGIQNNLVTAHNQNDFFDPFRRNQDIQSS